MYHLVDYQCIELTFKLLTFRCLHWKNYVIYGLEFGLENDEKIFIIVRALYGGKAAGADYWRHIHAAMNDTKV